MADLLEPDLKENKLGVAEVQALHFLQEDEVGAARRTRGHRFEAVHADERRTEVVVKVRRPCIRPLIEAFDWLGAEERHMIYEGNAARAHLKGEVKMTSGLGFISSVIIDSHFEKRGRFVRLAQAVAAHPGLIGIGLGEDTGMLITEGNKMEAIGSGLVIIIDGHNILHSNIADIPDGNPVSVENLMVHFCEKGNGFIVNERRFLMEESEEAVIPKRVDVE